MQEPNEATIWVVGVRESSKDRGFWDRSSIDREPVPVEALKQRLGGFVSGMQAIIDHLELAAGEYALDEVTVSVEIGAKGSVSLIGNGRGGIDERGADAHVQAVRLNSAAGERDAILNRRWPCDAAWWADGQPSGSGAPSHSTRSIRTSRTHSFVSQRRRSRSERSTSTRVRVSSIFRMAQILVDPVADRALRGTLACPSRRWRPIRPVRWPSPWTSTGSDPASGPARSGDAASRNKR